MKADSYLKGCAKVTSHAGPSRFRVVVTRKKQLPPKKEGEIDPKLWELLLSAPRKDYEKICFDFGVSDFRWMLKRLNQMKKEREDEQAKVQCSSAAMCKLGTGFRSEIQSLQCSRW